MMMPKAARIPNTGARIAGSMSITALRNRCGGFAGRDASGFSVDAIYSLPPINSPNRLAVISAGSSTSVTRPPKKTRIRSL